MPPPDERLLKWPTANGLTAVPLDESTGKERQMDESARMAIVCSPHPTPFTTLIEYFFRRKLLPQASLCVYVCRQYSDLTVLTLHVVNLLLFLE